MPRRRGLHRDDEIVERTLRFIEGYCARRGYSPTLDEVGIAIGYSRAGVLVVLDRLEMWGLVHRDVGIPRSIRVVESGRGED